MDGIDMLLHAPARLQIAALLAKVTEMEFAKLRELSPLWEMFKDGVDISSIQWAAH
mgnify:CR=1 FL=1